MLAEHVVIAAGSYAYQVGAWFGVKIPLVSCLHHYLVTDTVPEFLGRPELPMMRENSFGGYIRQEQKSGLIGIYEGLASPTVWTMPDGAPWQAENGLFDADYDAIGDFHMRAFDRMPILAELGIKRVVRGAVNHTSDGGMLVGPSGARNVWLACGSSIGLARGGVAGQVVAEWITTGQTSQNTPSMDPRRYGYFADDIFVVERTKNEFMRRNDTPVPVLSGRKVQRVLEALAEALQVPVVASTGHVDVTRHDHPWRAGQGGPRGNRVASRLTRGADVIVVLGARLGFNSKFYTSEFVNPKACIAHVNIDGSAAGRYSPVEIAVQADAFEPAQVLMKTPAPDVDPWREAFAADMTSLVADRADEAEIATLPMHPKRVLVEIREALPEEVIVTLDTGNTCLQVGDRLARYQSPDLVTPQDFGLVGFGMPAAIGVKAAAPGRALVAIMGVGSMGYAMIEVQTAVSHKLPVIFNVLDNQAWGAEKAYKQEFFGGRLLGAEIDSPRFDKFAELCGARGFWAEGPGDTGPALEQALASGENCFIQCLIDLGALMTLG